MARDRKTRPGPTQRHGQAARADCERVVRAGAELYDRARHLPRLARATPQEIASGDRAVGRILLARLMRALRSERRRGRAGHWSYDLNRHIALVQAIAAERARLMALDDATAARHAGEERPTANGQ